MRKRLSQKVRWIAPGICLLLLGCAAQPSPTPEPPQPSHPLRYLALGDSYTIGQGVAEAERWPMQLATRLRETGLLIEPPLIVARTGWTTQGLLAAIEREDPQGPFDLVSLLIGVNNQYGGRNADEYRADFRTLLEQAIGFAGGSSERVVVLSIPDWGVTPFASERDRYRIAREIDRFNLINREETERAGAYYVDITPLSRLAAQELALLASDGLHPSGAMYAKWVELALPTVLAMLQGPP
jgi:lysophospholipase L1-like esterase